MRSVEELKKELESQIEELEEHKPFVGVPEKDYYRGQWDALMWVLEELCDEEG